MSENKAVGCQGEEAASRYLEGLGYRILARNACAHGIRSALANAPGATQTARAKAPGKIISELDIVAQDGDVVVFVEVKTRRSLRCGAPLESITPHKMNQLRLAAAYYVRQNDLEGYAMRFDAISVLRQPEGWLLRHVKDIR